MNGPADGAGMAEAVVACGMSPEELAVWSVLQTRVGRAAAIPMADLAAQVGLGTRTLQSVVKHLVEDHHLPIGSSTGGADGVHGYYRVASPDDLERTVRQLDHRIISTARRKARLVQSTAARVLGQLTMDLEREETHGADGTIDPAAESV